MARLVHIVYGTLLLGLAGASTYLLCSEEMLLDQATLLMLH